MKTWLICVIAALALPLAAQEPQNPEFAIMATGEIEIGPDGGVHDYRLDNADKLLVENALGRHIRGWRFEPITHDGRPVIASTRMRIQLRAVPIDGASYKFVVDKVYFGQPERSGRMEPPRYPADAVRAGVSGRVLLLLKLDDEGNVERAHVEQTSLDPETARRRFGIDRWRDRFEQASVESARRWTFDMSESIDGEPMGGSVRVPVSFTLGSDSANRWQSYIPGPHRPAPWVDADSVAASAADELADGELQALESRFRLRNEVVGSTL